MSAPESIREDVQKRRLLKRIIVPDKRRWRVALVVFSLILAVVIWAWISREQIATDFIEQQLAEAGVEASYELVSVGPRQQILRNVVIGNPDRPDFTADRIVVDIGYGFQLPFVDGIAIENARLYGSYRDGKLSFGALDPLIFTESDDPAALPDINLALSDARARIETDFGTFGIKAEGAGRLNYNFEGTIAAIGRDLAYQGCGLQSATAFGVVTTDLGIPKFEGPIRINRLECEAASASVNRIELGTLLTVSPSLDSVDVASKVTAYTLDYADYRAGFLRGDIRANLSDDSVRLTHDIKVSNIRTPYLLFASIDADGVMRSLGGGERLEWESRFDGEGARLLADALDSVVDADALADTPFGPLLAKFERNLTSALDDGTISADVTARKIGQNISVVMPEGRVRSGSGETLLALSRFSWATTESGAGRLSANLETGGAGLPQISGRMERQPDGELALNLRMQEYSAGQNRLAIPSLVVSQSRGGLINFSGASQLSGQIPGGRVAGLQLPFEGQWSAQAGLIAGRRCTPVNFDSLEMQGLRINANRLRLCPEAGAPMITYRDSLEIAAKLGATKIAGALGQTPTTFSAENLALRFPGQSAFEGVEAQIGESGEGMSLAAQSITLDFGDQITGQFAGASAKVAAVPLVFDQMAGDWAYDEAGLRISDTFVRVSDANEGPRFYPLYANNAGLTLVDQIVRANAAMLYLDNPAAPRVSRKVTDVALTHNLASSSGEAVMTVTGLRFDKQVQPSDLTVLAEGVIALADGTISGEGRFNWNGENIASSGEFSTSDFDFAAAFGPVERVSGILEFTDLLNMTSAPSQKLNVGSINTGVEVLDGDITYQIVNGEIIRLERAIWPFMGGTLELRPLELNFSRPEERRYVFEVVGLNAADFVAQMEFGNLAATGIFDGTVPIVFDETGDGSIEGGLLISRPPGGNVSYVGELIYEDMGAMANFAFDALRSLDYRQMAITMDGKLAGEIITSVRFDGITQGEGSKQNIVTKQIAKLPIRFNINIRSQFWQLSVLLRSLYDATYLRSPCDVTSGVRTNYDLFRAVCPNTVLPESGLLETPDETAIQPQESETMP